MGRHYIIFDVYGSQKWFWVVKVPHSDKYACDLVNIFLINYVAGSFLSFKTLNFHLIIRQQLNIL